MISLTHLTKQFGATIAVNDLSLDIRAGEIFGLIGPDGAGKTTTLRILATALAPSAGRVTIDGLETTREPEAVKKIIGYMPQRFALYPDLTVRENLNFFADIFGAPRAQRAEQLARLLGFARLTEFQTRLARNLSGGMQKKLALAATLMHTPRVLLLDEPTTGVDPISRREFWDLLTQAHLQGVTILISTPYLDEAERCTRVGLMHRGQLLACDDPRALRDAVRAVIFEARASDARRARHLIQAHPGVLAVSIHGDLLRVITDRAERATDLQTVWRANALTISDWRIVQPRLEDTFVLMLTQDARRLASAGAPAAGS